ncbi:MAG: hypothetical protein A2583_08785 [Bdellovibrionales bacterium RIFOXYD1_FULL_53_11]|nr:MAG: hypothetical protein A2583_08785 [Bdellovibrionales bacterium RIFOXYD1_FULL_53_11]
MEFLTALLIASTAPAFEKDVDLSGFYKGNTHAHSTRSDGNAPPEKVVKWYRDHGYNFTFLTDHNKAAKPCEFTDLETPDFIAIAGEELSYSAKVPGADGKLHDAGVHVNSLCSTLTQGGLNMRHPAEALQHAITRVKTQPGAVAQINHPFFQNALSSGIILSTHGAALLEIMNMHPLVRRDNARYGGAGATEALWDSLLSKGMRLHGIASDDAHDFNETAPGSSSIPGRGWIYAAADRLEDAAICDAIAKGRFYFSTGAVLDGISVEDDRFSLRISVWNDLRGVAAKTEFIGSGGRLLATEYGPFPSYRLRGGEGYVRARTTVPYGGRAWSQAYYLSG